MTNRHKDGQASINKLTAAYICSTSSRLTDHSTSVEVFKIVSKLRFLIWVARWFRGRHFACCM
ncbi:MAG TPA: hypothetical protein V6D12_15695 [Candidatus Obscuribacterales bacterium]